AVTRRRCHWVSPSRRGAKRTPLGALRRSWGHREQLEDFPGEVGAPRHRVTPQSWGCLHSVTPQSWGHPHSVTPQSSEQLCVPPMVSDHKVGTHQSWRLSQRWECPHIPTMASHPKVGDPHLGTHSVRPPLQTALFPWGGGGGHPLFLGLRFI